MGIELLQTPKGFGNETPGPLSLPGEFDRKKFAAKWVKEGPAVAAAAEREWIPNTQVTADGWQVWRDSKGKPHKVALQSGVHVLLYRSQAVQEAVNAICGNVGKERLSQERAGETMGGIPIQDTGMLNESILNRVIGREGPSEEGDVKLNPVPGMNGPRVETPTLETQPTPKKSTRQE